MRLFLPFFLLLLGCFAMLRNRSQRSIQEQQEAFWAKETKANQTRKQDVSGLDYIQIPLDAFPIGRFNDAELLQEEEKLLNLSKKQILNLSGISNTDLKLAYGAANLPFLSECDANYTQLARAILSYGKQLAEQNHIQEAVTVLEFGISCKTDVSANYTLLADLYSQLGQTAKIEELRQIVLPMDSLMKNAILNHLESLASGHTAQ